MTTATKSPFASGSILASLANFAVFAALGAAGFHLDKAQTLGLIEALRDIWPTLAGMGTAIVVIYTRLKHVDFRQINWPGLVAGVLSLIASLGVDVHDLQHLVGDTNELVIRLPGILTSGTQIVRVFTAKKRLTTRRAIPV